jgi:hypothetical protein
VRWAGIQAWEGEEIWRLPQWTVWELQQQLQTEAHLLVDVRNRKNGHRGIVPGRTIPRVRRLPSDPMSCHLIGQ